MYIYTYIDRYIYIYLHRYIDIQIYIHISKYTIYLCRYIYISHVCIGIT